MFKQSPHRDQTSLIQSTSGLSMMHMSVMNLLRSSRMKRTEPEAKKMTLIKPSNDCLEPKVKSLEIKYLIQWRMFRLSHFWFLVFGHFWQQTYKITKILVIFVYILQSKVGKTEKNGKKIMQLKWPKYQKPKDENMGWTIRSLYSLGG